MTFNSSIYVGSFSNTCNSDQIKSVSMYPSAIKEYRTSQASFLNETTKMHNRLYVGLFLYYLTQKYQIPIPTPLYLYVLVNSVTRKG